MLGRACLCLCLAGRCRCISVARGFKGTPIVKTGLATLLACAWIACANAQTPAAVEPGSSTAANVATPQAPLAPATGALPMAALPASADSATCCHVVAETPVIVEVTAPLNSSRQHRGDYFALRLAEPITLDGGVVIPAGTPGVGQVVDAAAARPGGAPGKLVLAARHLDYAGQQLQLHAMKFGGTGANKSALSMGVSFAAGPFAMFIHGGEIEIPVGTRADAKLAPNVASPPAQSALSPSPSPSPSPSQPTAPSLEH
jgi:glucose/arabinose dehydrogenase